MVPVVVGVGEVHREGVVTISCSLSPASHRHRQPHTLDGILDGTCPGIDLRLASE